LFNAYDNNNLYALCLLIDGGIIMSFTMNVKNEISKLDIKKSDKAEKISELSAFFRNSCKKNGNLIDLYTENKNAAERIVKLIKDVYNVDCEILEKITAVFNRNIYYIKIFEREKFILDDLSVYDEKGIFYLKPEKYIVGSLDESKAYIRGTFLSCGSINDPKTSQYHLEFLFDEKEESIFVQRLLNEFELNAKLLLRDKKFMIYIKDSDDISDFLKILGASNSVMYYENVRAYKEQINITNRLNNCEQANIDKILMSCNEQIKDINLIIDKLGYEFFDEKLKEVVDYRLKYPESSLTELSEIISLETNKKITKSGLNHRFRKIRDIANQLKM